MFRFDRSIRRDMVVRDIKRSYPQTTPFSGNFVFVRHAATAASKQLAQE